MANNIFDIPNWSSLNSYIIGDIVYLNSNSTYYYCIKANSDSSFTASNWNGTTTYNGNIMPFFFWTPSYSANINNAPQILETKFGNGYTQTSADGLYNKLITLDLTFEKKKSAEIIGILHFLHTRGATQSFVFVPPFPRNKQLLFKCKTWNDSPIFFDNYSVKAIFQQVVV